MHQDRLPGSAGPSQEVLARRGAAGAGEAPRRHRGLQVRAGGAVAGRAPGARDGGEVADALRLGEGGGPRGPLLEGEEPAADRPARDRQDPPGQAHRDAA